MAEVARVDAGSSGLSSFAARWVMVLVWGTGVLHGALLGQFSASGPWGCAAYAAGLVAALLLTLRRPGPLPVPAALALVACVEFAVIVVLVQYTSPDTVWLLKFASYVVALAIPRGHPYIAGVGGVLLVAGVTVWAIGVGADLGDVLRLLANPIMSLATGYVWLVVLRRFIDREGRARRAAAEAAAQQRVAERARHSFRTDLADIRKIVQSPLEDIQAGRPLGERALLRARIAEARVRDGIRAPQLRDPRLDEAISTARVRGVEIVVLGEPDDRRRLRSDLALVLVGLVSEPGLSRVTLRSLPPGRQSDVSVVLESRRGTRQMFLPEE